MSKYIEKVRHVIRVKQFSLRTEKAYIDWIKRFIRFNEKQHPDNMGEKEVERFLTHLAVKKEVSPATQNQALCALVFLYRHVVERELVDMKFGYTKKEKRIPTVISPKEVEAILFHLPSLHCLIASILFGCGLRINEALALRIKDINFEDNTVFIFRGKGKKDRYSILPLTLKEPLKKQIGKAKRIHERDLSEGYGKASVPKALHRKYKYAMQDTAWQYIFPSTSRCRHPYDGYICRHHLHETAFRKALRKAVLLSNVNKRVTSHTFRHSFATEMLKSSTDIRTLQELMGHSDIRTTEIYTHVVGDKFAGSTSPLDRLNGKGEST
jgi:integron integrase